jgi:hypothetical protein
VVQWELAAARGVEHGLDQVADVAVIETGDGVALADSVVDQGVDAAVSQHGFGGAAAVLLIGQVGPHQADPRGGHALRVQQVTGLLELRKRAGEQHDTGAVAASPSATAPPIPRPAPVTSAVLPVKSVATAISSVSQGASGTVRRWPRPFAPAVLVFFLAVCGGRRRFLAVRNRPHELPGKTGGRRDAYEEGGSCPGPSRTTIFCEETDHG